MTTRERLARAVCHACYGHDDEPCLACGGVEDCCMWKGNLEVVDAILDELMEPGEGAIAAGFNAKPKPPMRCHRAAVLRQYQGVLTHIKDGKP